MESCLGFVVVIERARRLFLEILEKQLKSLGVYDVTPAQMMMMYNLGSDQVSTGSLITRGLYSGSNPAYNVKKIVSAGYAICAKSPHDRRNSMIKLTQKGLTLCKKVEEAFDEATKQILSRSLSQDNFVDSVLILNGLVIGDSFLGAEE